jgi:hypothetical protein
MVADRMRRDALLESSVYELLLRWKDHEVVVAELLDTILLIRRLEHLEVSIAYDACCVLVSLYHAGESSPSADTGKDESLLNTPNKDRGFQGSDPTELYELSR